MSKSRRRNHFNETRPYDPNAAKSVSELADSLMRFRVQVIPMEISGMTRLQSDTLNDLTTTFTDTQLYDAIENLVSCMERRIVGEEASLRKRELRNTKMRSLHNYLLRMAEAKN